MQHPDVDSEKALTSTLPMFAKADAYIYLSLNPGATAAMQQSFIYLGQWIHSSLCRIPNHVMQPFVTLNTSDIIDILFPYLDDTTNIVNHYIVPYLKHYPTFIPPYTIRMGTFSHIDGKPV